MLTEGESREKLEKQPSGETRSLLSPEKEQTLLPVSPKAGQGQEDGRKAGKKPQGREGDDSFTAGTTKGTGERYLPFELKGERGPPLKKGGALQVRNRAPLSRRAPYPLLEKRKMAGRKSGRRSRLPIEEKWKRLYLKKKFPGNTGKPLKTIFYPSDRKKEKSRMTKVNEQVEMVKKSLELLQTELSRVIVGQEELIRQVFICLLCGGHALIEGVPGLGKTLIVKSLGQVLNLKYSRIQFTPDLMPADIIGTNIVNEDAGRKTFF